MTKIIDDVPTKKKIVADLTSFFKLALQNFDASSDSDRKWAEANPRAALGRVYAEVASIVDFNTGSGLRSFTTGLNRLGSAEVAAIELVEYLCKVDGSEEGIKALYQVMNDTKVALKLPLSLSYNP